MTAAGAGAIGTAIIAFVAGGCGGPLDTPDPRPARDAGIDSGSGGRRSIDAAPDVVRDARVLPDAGFDTGIDAPWPVVPGCVTGLPPSPQFNPQSIPPITISCANSATILTRLSDAAGQGMIFSATLNPPIDGFSVSFNSDLCSFAVDLPIELDVIQSAAAPENVFNTALNVTVYGPPPQRTYVFPLEINTVAIDFTIDPAVVDFGTVTVGQSLSIPLTVTNAMDGAPLQNVYPSQIYQGAFQLFPSRSGSSLEPGDAQPLLNAVFSAQLPGTYDTTFYVSAFPPGSVANIGCGVVQTVAMHAQVVSELP